jgi:hypothetical protein
MVRSTAAVLDRLVVYTLREHPRLGPYAFNIRTSETGLATSLVALAAAISVRFLILPCEAYSYSLFSQFRVAPEDCEYALSLGGE